MLASPAAMIFYPAIRNPMPMSVRPNLMSVYPDVVAAAPVPVTRRPHPPLAHNRHCFVTRSRRRDPDIDIRRGGRRDHGGNRAGGKAQGDQRISLVHECILADFDDHSFARAAAVTDRRDADPPVGHVEVKRKGHLADGCASRILRVDGSWRLAASNGGPHAVDRCVDYPVLYRRLRDPAGARRRRLARCRGHDGRLWTQLREAGLQGRFRPVARLRVAACDKRSDRAARPDDDDVLRHAAQFSALQRVLMAALDIELALAEDADAHLLASFARDLIEAGLG